jgi:uncharacterized protein (DUF488 family)
MSVIHTVGHSTRSFAEFLALLQSAEINVLVDVRRFPASRRYPQFNRENLRQSLAEHGIEYVHEPDLGGRRESAEDSRNLFWRNASFRAYADYMSSSEFHSALERLLQAAQQKSVAVMCAEAVPWRCHRQLIADALVARGHEVRHILSESRSDLHELNPGAVVLAGGDVIYPGKAGAQTTLFEGRDTTEDDGLA